MKTIKPTFTKVSKWYARKNSFDIWQVVADYQYSLGGVYTHVLCDLRDHNIPLHTSEQNAKEIAKRMNHIVLDETACKVLGIDKSI